MVLLIAMIVGALVGVAASGQSGALAGALFGWLIVRSLRQQREIEALRKRSEVAPAAVTERAFAEEDLAVRADEDRAFTRAAQAPSADAIPAAPPASISATDAPLASPGALAAAAMAGEATWVASQASLAEAAAAAARPGVARDGIGATAPSDVFAFVRQWLFGGNTIVKVGIGILFVGLAFLAKDAAEHARLPVELRLAAIGAAAIALLGFGWRLRVRRPDYAQVLQGGAVAVLYLTLFAAFRYYGVLGAMPAFVLMVAVAALAAALAVLQDARSLAVAGALGGFATPLIVSTGSNNHVALFTYYLVLDAGIALVAWSKTWRLLNLVGFVATFLVATAWGVLQYRPDDYASSQAFLIAFFLVFVVILVLPARRLGAEPALDAVPRAQRDAWVNSSLLFGLPTIVFALEYGLVRDTSYGAALAALALAAFYVVLAAWMRNRPELGITFEATLAIATVFLTLVIPFALDERSTAGAWTLEGAGLVWIGFRQRRGVPRMFGYALLAIAAVSMLIGHLRYGAPTAVLNVYLFNGLMAAAASLAGALSVERARRAGTLGQGEDACEPLLIGFATSWLVATAAIEIDAFTPVRFFIAASLAATSVVAAGYAALARRLDWNAVAWPTLAHVAIAFAFALVTAAMLANPFANGGWWAWPLAFAVHAIVLRLAAPAWPRTVAHVDHALGAVTLALVGALLGRAGTARWGDAASAWPWLGWLLVPAVLLLVLPRPATARIWPVRTLPEAYRVSAAAALAAGLWLWTIVANVASDGSAAPLPHVPLLNPLDLGVGISLAAIVLWMKRARRLERCSIAMTVAAVFVWLNAMLVRSFHHYAGVPYHLDAWMASLVVQTGITLLWTAIALIAMWLAASRGARVPWVAGAALLATVVAKLLLVDLSGTVTRIVSFIGVGVLMLVIGYVAPPPAKEASRAAT